MDHHKLIQIVEKNLLLQIFKKKINIKYKYDIKQYIIVVVTISGCYLTKKFKEKNIPKNKSYERIDLL